MLMQFHRYREELFILQGLSPQNNYLTFCAMFHILITGQSKTKLPTSMVYILKTCIEQDPFKTINHPKP